MNKFSDIMDIAQTDANSYGIWSAEITTNIPMGFDILPKI